MSTISTFFNFLKEKINKNEQILFIGLGNIDRADDGFGIIVAREIKKLKCGYLVYNEQEDDIEEIFLKILNNNLSIDYIIYIDTVDADKKPGDLLFLDLNSVKLGHIISTHSSLLSVYVALLKKKCKGQYLLGVQPATLTPYQNTSDVVMSKIDELTKMFKCVLLGAICESIQ